MKYIIRLLILTFCLCSLFGCKNKNQFILEGTTSQDRLEGQYVFLVPMEKKVKDDLGIDSTIIKDHKFKFVGNREYIARLTIDYKIRIGLQELLVITGPGITTIILDSVSSSHGTHQNDALQSWKEMKEAHDKKIILWSSQIRNLKNLGDTAAANSMSDSLKIEADHFRHKSLMLADSVGGSFESMLNNIFTSKN